MKKEPNQSASGKGGLALCFIPDALGPPCLSAIVRHKGMSITIRPNKTDDPAFVALIERIVADLEEDYDPEEVFIIEIKNWFDHKWLKFSGIGRVPYAHFDSRHSQTALDEFSQEKITF